MRKTKHYLCEDECLDFLLPTFLELDSATSCSSAFCSSSNTASYRKKPKIFLWRYTILRIWTFWQLLYICESGKSSVPHPKVVWAPYIALPQNQNHLSGAPGRQTKESRQLKIRRSWSRGDVASQYIPCIVQQCIQVKRFWAINLLD